MRQIVISIFIFTSFETFGQDLITETERYISWTDSRTLNVEDFKGEVGACEPESVDGVNISASSCIGLWTVLDIPKSKRKYEKFYFAPVFDKSISWQLDADSIDILKCQIYFDLTELACRWGRKELYNHREQMGNPTGAVAIMYSTIKQEMERKKGEMFASYFNQVYRTNNLDSLQGWVNLTGELLEQTEEFATTPEEFRRLLTGEPEKGYKEPKTIVGSLGNN